MLGRFSANKEPPPIPSHAKEPDKEVVEESKENKRSSWVSTVAVAAAATATATAAPTATGTAVRHQIPTPSTALYQQPPSKPLATGLRSVHPQPSPHEQKTEFALGYERFFQKQQNGSGLSRISPGWRAASPDPGGDGGRRSVTPTRLGPNSTASPSSRPSSPGPVGTATLGANGGGGAHHDPVAALKRTKVIRRSIGATLEKERWDN